MKAVPVVTASGTPKVRSQDDGVVLECLITSPPDDGKTVWLSLSFRTIVALKVELERRLKVELEQRTNAGG